MSGEILDFVHINEIRNLPGRQGGTLFREFAALFFREEPARMAQLRQVAAARDWVELRRQAHMLAGSCAMLGAVEMQKSALKVQAAAKARLPDEAEAGLEAVEASWKRLQEALKENDLLPE